MRLLDKLGPVFVMGLLILIWGSSFILIKKALMGLAPPMMAAFRIFFAALFILPFGISRIRSVSFRQFRNIMFIAIAGTGIPAILFAYAQTKIPSAVAGSLNSLTPLCTFTVGYFIFGNRVSMRKILGIIVGLIGALILMGIDFSITSSFNSYSILVLIAVFCYGFSTNAIKYWSGDIPPLTIAGVGISIIGIVALISLVNMDAWTAVSSHPLGYQSLACTALLGMGSTAMASVLYFWLNHKKGPIYASSATYAIPVVAMLWGVLDREALSMHNYIGMLLILLGVFMITRDQS